MPHVFFFYIYIYQYLQTCLNPVFYNFTFNLQNLVCADCDKAVLLNINFRFCLPVTSDEILPLYQNYNTANGRTAHFFFALPNS